VAGELATQYPDASITTIRMGVPELRPAPDARARLRQSLALHPASVVFAAFGKVTAEKRIETILRALGTLATNGLDVHLLLVGDTSDYPALAVQADTLRVRSRVHDVGHIDDAAVADYLAVSDACLCLRWPTAQETSASWLRCLAARRATVISDLAHLADVPADVTLRVDLLDEDDSLLTAMSRLATDSRLRSAIADAGHAYWSEHHALDRMADDYRALLRTAAGCATPSSGTLPRHFTEDYSEPTRRIAERFGVSIDLLD
jgi:glycosyltransferase involved in cell wall biosynthesis